MIQAPIFDEVKRTSPAAVAAARVVGDHAAGLALEKAVDVDGFDKAGAARFMVGWLRRHGPMSSEDLVNAAIEHGYCCGEHRSFGGVIGGLSRRREIVFVESCKRAKGHGTNGGSVWRAA